MKRNYPTIGVLLDWIQSAYHTAIITGIQEEADKYKLNVLYFKVGEINSALLTSGETNHIYNLIDYNSIDYLLILPGVVHQLSDAAKRQFLHSLPCAVVVTICFEIPGFPCVLLGNRTGFQALVTHIIEIHHRTKLVFLAGPDNNQDSNERLQVFDEVLRAHNLCLNPDLLVTDTRYTADSGEKALIMLTNERKLVPGRDFDAVIAANDALAIGAVTALTRMPVNIPQDISVGGFNADDAGMSLDAPLTTVRQPYSEIGSKAVAFLMQTPKKNQKIVIPAALLLRQSCGCSPPIMTFMTFSDFSGAADACLSTLFMQDKAVLKAQINQVLQIKQQDYKPVDELLEKFHTFLENGDANLFLDNFRQILSSAEKELDNFVVWNYPLTVLSRWLMEVSPDNAEIIKFKTILDQGHNIINTRINLAAMYHQMKLENYILYLRYTDEMIRINLEQKQLLLNLTSEMNRIYLNSYHIFLYEYRQDAYLEYKLLISCKEKDPMPFTHHNLAFKDFSSIINQFLIQENPFSYFVLPISYNEQKYGFILIAMSKIGYAFIAYEDIAFQLGSNFKGNAILMATRDTNRKLQTANSIMERTRQQLEHEMKVAKTIQESLLPETLIHNELELAAKMVTAISVGGDYYDFIPSGAGRDWIIIGDASGHGMYAGMLMMMVQTAIHILIKQEPAITPSKLLNIVNDMIVENLLKLGDNKYITIVALSYQGNGLFTFAGMHLPLLLYRQKTQKVEIIKTDGIWLGVIAHTEHINFDNSIRLEKGDCLLLYTDGITEANSNTNNTKLYGDERLMEIFAQVGSKAPQAIIDDLFKDLEQFSIEDDDATLFVIKYK